MDRRVELNVAPTVAKASGRRLFPAVIGMLALMWIAMAFVNVVDRLPDYAELIYSFALVVAIITSCRRRRGLIVRLGVVVPSFVIALGIMAALYTYVLNADYEVPGFAPRFFQADALFYQSAMLAGLFTTVLGITRVAGRLIRRMLVRLGNLPARAGAVVVQAVIIWLIAIPMLFTFLQTHRPKLHYGNRMKLPFTALPDDHLLPPGRIFLAPEGSSDTTVILCHGINGNQELGSLVNLFNGLDCHVVTLDLPNHGYAPGYRITFGMEESAKVIRVARWLRDHPLPGQAKDAPRIVVYGMSLGAATALFAAERAPHLFDGLVADATFASLREMADYRLDKMPVPIRFALRLTGPFFVMLEIGVPIDEVDVTRNIHQLDGMPKLFVHGQLDTVIPIEQGRRVSQAAAGDVRSVEYPAGHCRSLSYDRSDYESELRSLLHAAGHKFPTDSAVPSSRPAE